MFTKMTSWGTLSTYFDSLEMAVDGSIVRGARGKGRWKRRRNQGGRRWKRRKEMESAWRLEGKVSVMG